MLLKTKKVILASASPRRRELLQQIEISFEVVVSDVDENLDSIEGSIINKIEVLALKKASKVVEDLMDRTDCKDCLVIGADTVVLSKDERVFGKPTDRDDAFSMLKELSGNSHKVVTGVAIVDCKSNKHITGSEVTEVFFDNISEEEIEAYLDTFEYIDKAGAYAIQGIANKFIRGINGCYSNVVGLPLNKLKRMIEELIL